MPLDTRTLIVVSLLTAGVIGLVLLMTWSINRSMSALRYWSAAFLFYAAGLAELALRGDGPVQAWNVLGVTLLGAAHLFVLFGTRSLSGESVPWRPGALGLGALGAAWFYFLLVEPDFSKRYAAYAVFTAVTAGLASVELFRAKRDSWVSALTVLAALYGLVAVVNGAHVIYLLAVGAGDRVLDSGASQTMQFLYANTLLVTVGICMAVVSTERLQSELRRSATYDRLTGVFNRGAFVDLAEKEFARWRRSGGAFSILLMDLDHFKRVNDTFGHAVGDAMLAAFARRCAGHLREGDLLGRYGGEEFCALLPGANRQQAAAVAERLRRDVAAMTIEHQGTLLSISVSIGVAEIDASTPDLDSMVACADTALYRAKRGGRNCVMVTEPALAV